VSLTCVPDAHACLQGEQKRDAGIRIGVTFESGSPLGVQYLMFKIFILPVCVVMSCLVVADALQAQQRGSGRGTQSRARYELATLPEVQADLKLDAEQKKLADELLAKGREKRQSLQQAGNYQAMRAEVGKLNVELDGQLSSKLDDTQKARLHGIYLQVNGPAALLDSDIAKALDLSEEQKAKLNSVNEENQAARRRAMQRGQDSSQEERRAAAEKLTADSNKAFMDVLTDDQKKKMESIKGASLTIDQTPLRTQGTRGRN
jgi:hypothetical protein